MNPGDGFALLRELLDQLESCTQPATRAAAWTFPSRRSLSGVARDESISPDFTGWFCRRKLPPLCKRGTAGD
jgi:hypothetical protein